MRARTRTHTLQCLVRYGTWAICQVLSFEVESQYTYMY